MVNSIRTLSGNIYIYLEQPMTKPLFFFRGKRVQVIPKPLDSMLVLLSCEGLNVVTNPDIEQ